MDEYNPYPEPYFKMDDEWGRCPVCNSGFEMCGAHSDGDGDLYDLLVCPSCGEESHINMRWISLDGKSHDTAESMWQWDADESERRNG